MHFELMCVCEKLYFRCTWLVLSLHIPSRAITSVMVAVDDYYFITWILPSIFSLDLLCSSVSSVSSPFIINMHFFVLSMLGRLVVVCRMRYTVCTSTCTLYTWYIYMYVSVCAFNLVCSDGTMDQWLSLRHKHWRVGNQSFQFFPFLYWFILVSFVCSMFEHTFARAYGVYNVQYVYEEGNGMEVVGSDCRSLLWNRISSFTEHEGTSMSSRTKIILSY